MPGWSDKVIEVSRNGGVSVTTYGDIVAMAYVSKLQKCSIHNIALAWGFKEDKEGRWIGKKMIFWCRLCRCKEFMALKCREVTPIDRVLK